MQEASSKCQWTLVYLDMKKTKKNVQYLSLSFETLRSSLVFAKTTRNAFTLSLSWQLLKKKTQNAPFFSWYPKNLMECCFFWYALKFWILRKLAGSYFGCCFWFSYVVTNCTKFMIRSWVSFFFFVLATTLIAI